MDLLCFFLLFLFHGITLADESCKKGDSGCSSNDDSGKMKYKMKDSWNNYLQKIKEANENYKGCENLKIGCFKHQIDDDLSFWEKRGGIKKEELEKAIERKVGVHYQIINHKLYRQPEDCIFPSRCSGNEHFILKIIKKLPNMEFIINSHDWPKVPHYHEAMPVFSFSKTKNERDIMYPAWTFWEGGPAVWPIYPTGLGRWDIQIETISNAAKKWPWDKKENRGFFRGSRTSDERDPLILLSRENPALVDAQYTKNQAWKSDADTLYAAPAKEIPLEDHCNYKYLFNFRGVAASFRFKHLFLCNSLVFHVGDEWNEFFYSALKPWVHYIPVPTDLSNARDLIEFAQANDEIVKEIAKKGRDFILSYLKLRDVEEYWKQLLKRYAKLLNWKPKRNKKFKEVRDNVND